MPLQDVFEIRNIYFNVLGHQIIINIIGLVMTWLVMIICFAFALLIKNRIKYVPTRLQSVAEVFVLFVRDMVFSTLGTSYNNFVPLICCIFLFVLFSNWIGLIPNLVYISGVIVALVLKVFGIIPAPIVYHSLINFELIIPADSYVNILLSMPVLVEPTRYLSTDIGLALMVFFIVHGTAIRYKGFSGYIETYFHPVWYLAPLNLIEELAKVLSHGLRLFGNILGGSIIILIVSALVKQFALPILLQLFFGFVIGIIQAFVFTVLAMIYISLKIK